MEGQESLGDILAKALDAQHDRPPSVSLPPAAAAMSPAAVAPKPKAPSLHELAKRDDATAFVKAWRAKYRD